MHWVFQKLVIFLAVFFAFCIAGYLASSIENIYESLIASTAVFGVSFVSIIGGAIKLWYDIFS
jgi:hypothetical protein